MDLRAKLNALAAKPKQATPPEPISVPRCRQVEHLHPLEEFPGAFDVGAHALMLMQGEPLPEPLDPRRILYLDTETTGFQGAGTVAFMIGCGWLTDEGFVVRQYVLRDYPDEPDQLRQLEELLRGFDVLCTFNGRSFDVPLLQTRFLMQRMRSSCLEKPHIDLLHIARRVWKLRLRRCRLGDLEERILGRPREDDLPGSEAPERFFEMLRTGEPHALDGVLKHNEQDVASMCTLLAHMHRMYEQPESVSHQEDIFSMGVALEKEHHPEEARRCYRLVSSGRLRARSQQRTAVSLRREGRRDEACAVWQEMIRRREGGALPYRELAKYYEHTAHDLPRAIRMTRLGLMVAAEPTLFDPPELTELREDLTKRYDRLRKKLEAREKKLSGTDSTKKG